MHAANPFPPRRAFEPQRHAAGWIAAPHRGPPLPDALEPMSPNVHVRPITGALNVCLLAAVGLCAATGMIIAGALARNGVALIAIGSCIAGILVIFLLVNTYTRLAFRQQSRQVVVYRYRTFPDSCFETVTVIEPWQLTAQVGSCAKRTRHGCIVGYNIFTAVKDSSEHTMLFLAAVGPDVDALETQTRRWVEYITAFVAGHQTPPPPRLSVMPPPPPMPPVAAVYAQPSAPCRVPPRATAACARCGALVRLNVGLVTLDQASRPLCGVCGMYRSTGMPYGDTPSPSRTVRLERSPRYRSTD